MVPDELKEALEAVPHLSIEEEAEMCADVVVNTAHTIGDVGLKGCTLALVLGYREHDEIIKFTKEFLFNCSRIDWLKANDLFG